MGGRPDVCFLEQPLNPLTSRLGRFEPFAREAANERLRPLK